MPTYTYRITSTLPWAEVVEEIDTTESHNKGRALRDAGVFTESAPVDIDANTREFVLNFPDSESYAVWKLEILNSISSDSYHNPNFSSTPGVYDPNG